MSTAYELGIADGPSRAERIEAKLDELVELHADRIALPLEARGYIQAHTWTPLDTGPAGLRLEVMHGRHADPASLLVRVVHVSGFVLWERRLGISWMP